MHPSVVIVGRPNVGKSTLVNRFVGGQEAIVESQPGVTRDWQPRDMEWSGKTFTIIDTGGWLSSKSELDAKVSRVAETASRQADLIIMVIDATTGITTEDEQVADWVRRRNLPTLVVANKVDNERSEAAIWDALALGLGEPFGVSALHGRNAGDLLDVIIDRLDFAESVAVPEPRAHVADEPRVAIVGRPNVGKSTLFNRLVGSERAIVHDESGTTRDIVDTVVETEDGPIRFVDTAGMRRKSRVEESVEYYSLVRSLKAIDTCDVVIFVIDATAGVTNQDQRLAERIEVSGKPMVIALNKWELLDAEGRADMRNQVEDELSFVSYAPVLQLSAMTGKGAHRVLPAIWAAVEAYTRRIPTAEVTRSIAAAQSAHPGPSGLRITYATQGAIEPPTFVLFSNRQIPPPYLRYLERKLREDFALGPTPLKMRVKRK